MAISDTYKDILSEILREPYKLKDDIIKAWGYENFDVRIELTYDSIKDEYGNNAFGAFYPDKNIIKISYIELINFVGIKICNDNLHKIGTERCESIFKYYVLYVLAHELHHAYLYNVSKEQYLEIKFSDEELDYKIRELEQYADEYALKYMSTYDIIAKDIANLAIELREGKYKEFKNKDETSEECKFRYINERIEKLMNK